MADRPVALPELAPPLMRCVDEVPDEVQVGLHLCYGDYGHQHFADPESLQSQVELLNAVVAASHRSVDWASFTVPQARGDAEYFAPPGRSLDRRGHRALLRAGAIPPRGASDPARPHDRPHTSIQRSRGR